MCDPIKGFKLCTCINEPVNQTKNSRRRKKSAKGQKSGEYSWRLLRYVKTEPTGLVGTVTMPLQDLGSGLTEEYVLQKLNSENCFDFDYTPRERDCLTIQVGEEYSNHMVFTFKEKQWIVGRGYDVFDDVMEDLGEGKLKLIH